VTMAFKDLPPPPGLREPKPNKPIDADCKELLTARVFDSRDGHLWLNNLAESLLWQNVLPEESNEKLRFYEGQRQLLREIMRWLEVGRELRKPPSL
jgi:hypothetical protein